MTKASLAQGIIFPGKTIQFRVKFKYVLSRYALCNVTWHISPKLATAQSWSEFENFVWSALKYNSASWECLINFYHVVARENEIQSSNLLLTNSIKNVLGRKIEWFQSWVNFKTLLVPRCAHRWQFDVARRTADVQNFCTQVVGNKRQISPLSLSFKRMAALSLPRTSTTELKAERVGLACALLCTAAKMAKNWRPCTLSTTLKFVDPRTWDFRSKYVYKTSIDSYLLYC